MGAYNIYAHVQLKVEDQKELQLKEYKLGDLVPLRDGIYAGYEGIIVVLGGGLVAFRDEIINKWGNAIDLRRVLDEENPVNKAIAKGGKR